MLPRQRRNQARRRRENLFQEMYAAPVFEEDISDPPGLVPHSNSLANEYIQEIDSSCANGNDWMKVNCTVCSSPITLEEYTIGDFPNLVSIKIYDIHTKKFGKGQCILKEEFVESLNNDKLNSHPSQVFSVYEKNTESTLNDAEGLKRGLGTRPNYFIVIKLNLQNMQIFVTIESAYTLLHSGHKTFYAIPLFGGKRRRVGNLEGNLLEISSNHGQIPGFLIYSLYTKDEVLNKKVTVEPSPLDDTFQTAISMLMLDSMPHQYIKVVKDVIDYII